MASFANDYTERVSDLGNLLYENFKGEIQPWLDVIAPVAGLFATLGAGQYSMEGKKLVIAADDTYSGGAMATDGHLPAPQYVEPIRLETTPARIYVRRAVDDFAVAVGGGEATFQNFFARVNQQMWDAFERTTVRHIHGSSEAIVCKVKDRTSATVVTVEDGFGYDGAFPTLFLEEGMTLASLDATNSFAVLGVAPISAIDHDTDTTTATATITFASSIEGSGTIATGDLLVFCTSGDASDDWFVTERNKAPLGLIDILDPASAVATYMGVTESAHPRIKPIVKASSDWGEVEFMEWIAQIRAKSNAPVTPTTHTITMHDGPFIELAKSLLPYTQIQQKGKDLPGGWETVRIGGFDFLTDPYHLPDVAYALCMEDLFVVPLDGEPALWAKDGSEYSRLANFDGREFFAKHYVQRFARRRNRMGVLTGLSNTNAFNYTPVPA